MGWAFFPLDEQLGLLGGSLCPSLQRKLIRLTSHLPFEIAVNLFQDFCGVALSRETARRLAEEAGARYVEYQTKEVERIEQQLPACEEILTHAQVSVDGAMVPLVGGEWAEVKTVAIGLVSSKPAEQGEVVPQCSQLSYFSRLAEADRFGREAIVETHRRGVAESAKVSAVVDGAEWLQGFIDLHCPKATRILDFPHAAQRLAGIGEAIWGSGTSQTRHWLAEKLNQLKQQGVLSILGELEQLQREHPKLSVIEENLNYLKKRQAQMAYEEFRAEGHPIGSGIVESANKLVVEARLKGAGMHWQRHNVNPILGLRNAECNGRWEEAWDQISRLKHQQRAAEREKRRLAVPATQGEEGATAKKSIGLAVQPKREVSVPDLPKALASSALKKPAADHPWRKAKIGRAKFELAKVG